jgi:hypothetical protein
VIEGLVRVDELVPGIHTSRTFGRLRYTSSRLRDASSGRVTWDREEHRDVRPGTLYTVYEECDAD